MKHRFGLFALMLALTTAQPALAQDEDSGDAGGSESALSGRHYYVSPMFSFTRSDKDRGTDDGLGGIISVGKKVTSGMTLELTGFYSSMDPASGTGGSVDLKGAGVGAMIFPFNSSPNFFAVLALMYGAVDNHPGPIPNYRTTVFDAGVGYLYAFNRHVLLRTEARYRTDQHDRKEAGINGGSKAFTDGLLNVGLVFPLGVTPLPAEEEEVEMVEAEPLGELDSDGDGVPDSRDQCPDTPAGMVVNDIGCPLDSDGDGVSDHLDECPNTPAGAKVLANGCALVDDCRTPRPGEQVDENGCAVEKSFVLRGVKFEFDSDRLTQTALQILNEVAETLQAYGHVDVELEGHTDSIGTDAYNLGLSERRANTVKTYLVGRGVEARRMTPVGYGESQPIADNETEEGREENRRVELRVIED